MREIFRQYGSAIISVIAVSLFFVLLFIGWNGGGNIFHSMGSMVSDLDHEEDFNLHADKVEFDAYAARKPPVVTVKYNVQELTQLYLFDCFSITDNDGFVYNRTTGTFMNGSESHYGAIHVLSIKDENGHEYIDDPNVYNPATQQVYFPKVSTYYVHMQVFDYYNVESDVTMPIAVDLKM